MPALPITASVYLQKSQGIFRVLNAIPPRQSTTTIALLRQASLKLLPSTNLSLLSDRCHSPKTVGPCRASFHRWWYNATSQLCQKFIFGGCKSNANNFISEQDCFQTCIRGEPTKTGLASEVRGLLPSLGPGLSSFLQGPLRTISFPLEFCAAPRVVGPCRASFLRWYFDLESRMCKTFIYGGCHGNKNNYLFEEHCWSQCSVSFSSPAMVLAVLLAILVTILLGSMGVFFVKICRKNPELSVGTVWSTLDDKEYLMSNAYTL
uniref:Serine peptidase inhibitor, Kunitz type 2 n=1 Tax=Naja naja TaxID=35670 RepID=A0A8C6YIM8_NAJNA